MITLKDPHGVLILLLLIIGLTMMVHVSISFYRSIGKTGSALPNNFFFMLYLGCFALLLTINAGLYIWEGDMSGLVFIPAIAFAVFWIFVGLKLDKEQKATREKLNKDK